MGCKQKTAGKLQENRRKPGDKTARSLNEMDPLHNPSSNKQKTARKRGGITAVVLSAK